ncbi:MAG: DUF1385 domain-containing protein [Clostridia bacterium]|nr:DUF1385 domain-containing protein [Clostridia bacterium]
MSNKNESASCPAKKTSIGGQALLEGIMMRGPKKSAMAVRRPDGEMVIEVEDLKSANRKGFLKWPVVRGVVNFIDSMAVGYKATMRSAELSGLDEAIEEEEREKAAKKAAKEAAKRAKKLGITLEELAEREAAEAPAEIKEESSETPAEETDPEIKEEVKEEKKDNSGMMTGVMVIALVLGLGLALLLFKVLPESIYELITWAFPSLEGEGYWFNLIRAAITGVVKILIMVAYMAAVTLMKDIRRTFMYHGAEHKTIFCYEQGLELTVENVRKQKRFHPRCGTSFLILMLLVSIVVNMFIPATLVDHKILNIVARTGIGLLTLPFIMGIGYELIRFAGKHDNLFTRIISAPGVWLQHITTKEPDDSMIECAIAAVNEVIPEDGSDNW